MASIVLVSSRLAFCFGTTPICAVSNYKMLSPTSVLVQCGNADTSNMTGAGGNIYLGTDLSTQLPATVTAVSYPAAPNWILVSVVALQGQTTAFSFQKNATYNIVINLSLGGVATIAGATKIALDTKPILTVSPVPAKGPNTYEVNAHVAFTGFNVGQRTSVACGLIIENFDGTMSSPLATTCTQLQYDITPGSPDPDTVGSLELVPGNPMRASQGVFYKINGLSDILGQTLTLDPKSRISQSQAPATKDASFYYLNGSYAAGVGSKPGWIIDAKVAPPVGKPVLGLQFAPSVTANIGHNSISGMTYTDTIDLGVTASRPFEMNGQLEDVYVSGGLIYETDREFDKENLTGTFDAQFYFKHLYAPQTVRTLRKFRTQQLIAKQNNIDLQVSDVPQAIYGYALDFHTGLEAGSALIDTTAKATTGKATILVPSYGIARVVTQAHGLLQLSRVSVDLLGTARYLATTENTVVQLPSNQLLIKPVSGWHGYSVLTSSVALDQAKHFSFSVVYKNGFAPPKFSRINAVQSGLTIAF